MFKTRQSMYVQSNTEAPTSIHCFSGKVTSITYFECVFVALVIQHAKRMRRIVICGLSSSTIFFNVISDTAPFSKKRVIEHEMCVLIYLQILFKTFLILRRIERNMIKIV
jgi:hypothetical protein